jgi:hypothetical protein
LVDFGVERDTLVTGKITHVFHHSSAVVTQGRAAREHLSRVRAQLLRRLIRSTCSIQEDFRDSPLTQVESKVINSFSF